MGFRRTSLSFIFVTAALLALPPRVFPAQQDNSNSATLKVPGVTIDVTLPEGPMKLTRDDLLDWVKSSATTVANYYGHFPVPHLTLKMRSTSGSGIRHGVTYARDGGLILISVGSDADIAATKDDWVLVHEMIHLAFPSMDDEQHWIEEGISTYVEPVARVRAGGMPLDEMWRTFVRDMPKGEPGSGDRGLDNTHTWGRTYWGGAIFCLLARRVASANAQETTKDLKMPCAASIAAAATSAKIGTLARPWQWATKPQAQLSCVTSTTRCATSLLLSIWTSFGRNLASR